MQAIQRKNVRIIANRVRLAGPIPPHSVWERALGLSDKVASTGAHRSEESGNHNVGRGVSLASSREDPSPI